MSEVKQSSQMQSCIIPSLLSLGENSLQEKPKSMRKNKGQSNLAGNLFFFGNDSFHHCLQKPSNTKAKKFESYYFGASTDAQFTRHHYLLETNEIIKVASGDFHSLFLTRDKRVIVAGKNKVSFEFFVNSNHFDRMDN